MKRKMNFFKKAVFVFTCLTLTSTLLGGIHAEAATKRKENTKGFFFITPYGQAASVNALAIITETYTKQDTKNKFTKRDCFLAYSREYSASMPTVTRTNGVHKASSEGKTVKTFTPWHSGSYLWDVAVRPFGGGSYNTTAVSYKKTTKKVSGFSYTVYCSGTLVPTQAGSVFVSLKTK